MSELSVRALEREITPKPAPDLKQVGLRGQYAPSRDGIDANLLILLHGIGDSEQPFFKLGQQLALPQTAVLALRAPLEVPLLGGGQWMQSFDLATGDILPNADPSQALATLRSLISHLQSRHWSDDSLHLFGFAQGGSVAVELVRSLPSSLQSLVGSVISISGPLLSHPASATPTISTPLMAWHRLNEKPSPLSRVFKDITTFKAPDRTRQGMPASQDEWRPIIACVAKILIADRTSFYAAKLRHKQSFEMTGGDEQIFSLS